MSRFRGLEVNAMAAKGVSRRLCMHRVIIFILINLFLPKIKLKKPQNSTIRKRGIYRKQK